MAIEPKRKTWDDITAFERELPSGKWSIYLDLYKYKKGRGRFVSLKARYRPSDTGKRKAAWIDAERECYKRANAYKTKSYGLTEEQKLGKDFIEHCKAIAANQQSTNSRLSWEFSIKHLENFKEQIKEENLKFGDLNREFFEGFRSYLLNEVKISPNSARLYFARIRTAINRAIEDGYLPLDPSAGVKIKTKATLPIHLTLDEIQKLYNAPCPNDQTKAGFLFGCFTGLRHSDVDALTWDNVRDGYLEFSQKKTGEAERMPLSQQAVDILEGQRNAKPGAYNKRQFQPNAIFFMPIQQVVNRQLKTWAKAAGINKRISFHKSRHTFGTLSLSSGVDLYTTSKLLGHKNLQTTQIYAKVVDEKKRAAVGMLPTLTPKPDQAS